MNQHIFREYDIRGIVDEDLTSETVSTLAKAIGTFFRQNQVKQVCLGFDARESSTRFRDLMAEGLNKSGLDVLDIGMVPTPLVYFSLFTEDVEAAIMITGSHNPSEFNGFKLCLGHSTIFGEKIQQIKEIALTGDFAEGEGKTSQKGINENYLNYLLENINLGNRQLKVVLDAGNGVGGVVGSPLYKKLGCEVIDLFIEPDSSFPNHHPDPTVSENMRHAIDAVIENKADLAIVFDGDGDRIGVVDEKGQIIWGDEQVIIFARSILKNKPDSTFIAEVKCSQTLFDDIEKHGGKAIMSKVGHSLIKAKMKETKAVLAGEMSGHIFFADRYFGFDDAIYAGARLLEILSNTEKNLSEFLSDLPKAVNTPEIRIDCPDENKFAIVEKLTEKFQKTHKVIDIDGARIIFENGWGLIRSSNTQPVLVMRFEAINESELEKIQSAVTNEVENLLKEL